MGSQPDGLEPYKGVWTYAQAQHLLCRATIGPTQAEIQAAVTDGLNTTIARLFTPFTPDTSLIDAWVGQDPSLVSPEAEGPANDKWFWQKLGRRYRICQWWLKVMADSPVSLQERMTLFWHGLFVTEMGKVEFAEFAYVNNQMLRRNALGNFRTFIGEVTKDVGMLTYLDGLSNTKETLNENYARELMELFTMGRVDKDGNPNYTQKDVSEAARALTGWRRIPSALGSEHGGLTSFKDLTMWDSGTKTFLGRTGQWDSDDVMDIILSERTEQVAWFISSRLYRFLVSDTPDIDVVKAMANLFVSNNWEIRPVVEGLLRSAHFFLTDNKGCMEKSLNDFYITMVRGMYLSNIPDFKSSSLDVAPRDLQLRLERQGHLVFHPPNVSGWKSGRNWVSPSALVSRLKFAHEVVWGIANSFIPGWYVNLYRFDPLALARTFPNPYDPDRLCIDMATYFLGSPPSAAEYALLYAALLDGGTPGEWNPDDPVQRCSDRIRKLLSEMFNLPRYQLY